MMHNRLTFSEERDHASSGRDVAAAWIVVTLLLCATVVGFVLDRAATISP